MNNKPDHTRELLRRALVSQLEMGISEVIIKRNPRRLAKSDLQTAPQALAVSELFPDLNTELLGRAEYDSLASHNAAICSCLKCPLGSTRTKFVYGVGSPKAQVVFVG